MAFHEIKIGSKNFTLAPKYIQSPDTATTDGNYGFLLFKYDESEPSISKLYSPGVWDLPVIKYSDGHISAGCNILPDGNNNYSVGSSSLKFNEMYATTFHGTFDGLATVASSLRITETEPTSLSVYYPCFVSGFISGTNYSVRANSAIRYSIKEGSTTQTGSCILHAGNSTAEGTNGNMQGALRIYGNKTSYGEILGTSGSSNVSFYLPNTGGTLVTHATRGEAVGGTAKPVYIASTGRATACSSTVGGTAKPVYMNAGVITYCSSTVGSASRPVYMNAGTITNCTWGTSMTSGTNYYIMGASSSTAGLVYNTNVKVLTNAIYASSGFYESSDERLKDFQEDIEVNFSYLHNIPKKYYSWKDDATYTRHIGTSAQEVQKYYPELVNTDDNGYLTMNYDKLSVVALKAIDVLHEEVTELKKENAELKERLARLEELILNR